MHEMVELTRREAEISLLAAEGLEDKEIAAHLGISPRTVGHTLGRAYKKLGVSRRKDLPGKLGIDYLRSPLPISSPPQPSLNCPAPGELPGVSDGKVSQWWLPPPPRRNHRHLVILAFTVGAAVLTIGIVVIIGAGISLIAGHAPPEAILALD